MGLPMLSKLRVGGRWPVGYGMAKFHWTLVYDRFEVVIRTLLD